MDPVLKNLVEESDLARTGLANARRSGDRARMKHAAAVLESVQRASKDRRDALRAAKAAGQPPPAAPRPIGALASLSERERLMCIKGGVEPEAYLRRRCELRGIPREAVNLTAKEIADARARGQDLTVAANLKRAIGRASAAKASRAAGPHQTRVAPGFGGAK